VIGPSRFEVDGANTACAHLGYFDISVDDKNEVWLAIAMHTSQGIVDQMGEMCRLVRWGVELEFGREDVEGIEDLVDLKAQLESQFRRGMIEKVLGDAVVEQAIQNPLKAPGGSWPGDLYRSHLANPDWHGVNKDF
jgi:hypothetical protein